MTSRAEMNRMWDAYCADAGDDASMSGFGAWLVLAAEANVVESESAITGHPIFDRESDGVRQSAQVSYLLARLHRLLRLYLKPVIHQHGLATADDFGFLATIHVRGSIGKAELCEHACVELSTGMDVIRRLSTAALVAETVNPSDRREKLLTLTPAGGKTLHSVMRDIDGTPDVLADLSPEARTLMVGWLEHLDHYHTSAVKNRNKP